MVSLVTNPVATAVGLVSVLTMLHMGASAYKLYLLWLGWRRPADATTNADGVFLRVAPTTVADALLPVYTILVPLYREAAVLRQLTDAIQRLDWPKEKLDVRLLLEVLHRLVDLGNTVVVIEHNLHVVKTADWVIDLGPEGGEEGGRIVAEGRPEEVAGMADSHTGQHLAPLLNGC